MDEKTKKKRLFFLAFAEILLITVLVVVVLFGFDKVTVTNIGNPYALDFEDENYRSRVAFDLAVFDGKLFVGGGDYDENTGPVYVHSYDISSGEWKKSAEPLPDEQIKRFRIAETELYIAGTDPKDDWEKGNFYRYENGEFVTHRVLDGAVHNFDIALFDGKTFFGLGVVGESSPVVAFDGENYSPVPFYKNGELLNTAQFEIIRVYNFLIFDGNLYAFLSFGNENEALMDLYAYKDGAFSHLYGSLPSVDMTETLELQGRAFLLMGNNLFSTHDLLSFENVPLGAPVADVLTNNDKLFVLCSAKKEISSTDEEKPTKNTTKNPTEEENSYINTIYATTDGKNYEVVISFESPIFANSFAFDGESGTFFVSLGGYDSPLSENVGKILMIKP